MKKEIEHICNNCVLYNPQEKICTVNIMYQGEPFELETKPGDRCHWERVGKEMGIDILSQIKEIRVWREGDKDYIELPDSKNDDSKLSP